MHMRKILKVTGVFSVLVGSMQIAMSTTEVNPLRIPVFSPAPGSVIVENRNLADQCEAETLKTFPGAKIEYAVTVQNEDWDDVWYADVTAYNDRQGRIVCWIPSGFERAVINSKFLENDDGMLPGKPNN